MAAGSDYLVWIDCEMTGLDPVVDELVEVAVVITDAQLLPVDSGLSVVIKAGDAALAQMNDFVTAMHTESGLLEQIPEGISLVDAEQQVFDYIAQYIPEARTAPLAGNTIGTDRVFLAKYMPRVETHLHYRSVDVSSVKELARRWYPRSYFQAPPKNGGHRALVDILESIRELAYYRRAVFVPSPGPTTAQAQAAQLATVNEWSARIP